MIEAVTLVAVGLLALGVVGAVVPLLPGPLLSLAGVLLYWWSTGFAAPGPVAVAAFVAVGLAAIALDYFGGAVAAGAGGASAVTALAAGGVGIVLLVFTGPIGALLGVAATVFLLELRRHADPRRGLKTAAVATVGMLGSTLVQVLLTGAMLVAFLFVVFG